MPARLPNIPEVSRNEQIARLLESGTFLRASALLNGLGGAEVAHLIESSPPPSRTVIWTLLDEERKPKTLKHLSDDLQGQFAARIGSQELAVLSADIETDDLVDILHQLPEKVTREVLQAMDAQDRKRIDSALHYSDDCAGGMMNTDTITVRPIHPVEVVLRYLRRHNEIPEDTDRLYVVNRKDQLIGQLPIAKLLVSNPANTVREIMLTDIDAVPVDMAAKDVANRFERDNWISAPVIDEDNRLLGRITIDDVVDVIREDAEHSLMSMAGLDEEEDTFSPVLKTTPRRAIWLGVNLLTTFIAASVINLFHDAIDKVVALAILMPIVASMGGVAGTQTLTIVIRGLATGQIESHNHRWLFNRELLVSVVNAMMWSTVVACATTLWFNDIVMGLIIALAMVITLVTAAIAGVVLPIALKKMNIDPALAGGVMLTTVTDVVGFMSFLGLATIAYA